MIYSNLIYSVWSEILAYMSATCCFNFLVTQYGSTPPDTNTICQMFVMNIGKYSFHVFEIMSQDYRIQTILSSIY